jgi:hypothetical protein
MEADRDRPGLPPLWPWLILCGVMALWIDLGEYHRYHTSDSIVPVLVSLYKWTPYYWEANRIGMLVPLLALPFTNPLTNLLVQGWLVLFAALASVFLLARWLLRSPSWPMVGCVASGVLLLLATGERFFVNTFGQPHYAVGLALGLGAVLLTELGAGGRMPWRRWPAALAMTLLAHWVNSGTVLFLAPVLVVSRMAAFLGKKCGRGGGVSPRVGETVQALAILLVGAVGSGLLRRFTPCRDDPVNNGFLPWQLWPRAWAKLGQHTWQDAFAAFGEGYAVLAVVAGLLLVIPTVRRQAGASLRAAGALLAGGLAYGMFMGTLVWVARNEFCYKYLIPLIFYINVALAAALTGPLLATLSTRARKRLALLAVPSMLLAIAAVHGIPSRARARAELECVPWDPALAQRTQDLLDLKASHIAGSYSQVWMSVFHANLVLHERGEDRVVWGVAGRCIPTWATWGRMQPEDIRIAAFTEGPGLELGDEARTFVARYFPPLSAVKKKPLTWLLRPADEMLPPECDGDEPIMLSWHGGFFGPQAGPDRPPHCKCGTNTGKLTLTNPSGRPRLVRVEFHVVPSDLLPGHFWVEGARFADEIELGEDPRAYRKTLTLPPGKTTLRLSCDARRTPILADQMNIVFHVVKFAVTEIASDTVQVGSRLSEKR